MATARIRSLDSQIVNLEKLAVLSTTRGIGIGKKLMEDALEILEQKNIFKVVIHAQEDVTGFYQKLGFGPVEERWVEETICYMAMEKSLLHQESCQKIL